MPVTELDRIPGVGVKMARELRLLGYTHIAQLKGQDPEQMYERLTAMHGRHIDRCVLYVFRCAVYFASHTVHEPTKLKWWYWSDKDR